MPESNEKSFELKLSRLEEIVSKLEAGGLPLDDSLKLFEEGQTLVGGLRKKLEDAQVKVHKLLDGADTEEIDPNELGR